MTRHVTVRSGPRLARVVIGMRVVPLHTEPGRFKRRQQLPGYQRVVDPARPLANPLAQVGLDRLMAVTSGRPEIVVGLIDGPIAMDHPGFDGGRIRLMTAARPVRRHRRPPPATGRSSRRPRRTPRRDGAGDLSGCSLLSRPVFADDAKGDVRATPDALAAAIEDCVERARRS